MIPDGLEHENPVSGIETSTPVICFERISPCCLWTSYFNLVNLIEAGNVPFKGNDLDELVENVPGAEHILRKRDLALFCRTNDLSDPEIKYILEEARTIPLAQGLILNTFEQLDGLILPHMRNLCPNTPQRTTHGKHYISITGNLLLEHLATMTVSELLEIWHGLVNSGKPFLWARRPGSITGGYDEAKVPSELLNYTKEIGCIVDWAPQEDVLAHHAIGAFFTHSGWNSTMESIVQGVPMICWPFYTDQQAIRDVMDMTLEVFTHSTSSWKDLAKDSIKDLGSSSINLVRLINDIRAMTNAYDTTI
ncbi:UDP-glucuronosyl/UDP-glucosyltransferase [Artemisia annua]|uniref:UDP-glucuronosyl/UDP-glucosyltransferase n=1 Tax=Artemisia annua TaxID=35608 RepID=A0A2U1NEW1_ARTAN|nr:UDP-glucuronosyl/UDP-glucosyltransferase [Artemisia annua]